MRIATGSRYASVDGVSYNRWYVVSAIVFICLVSLVGMSSSPTVVEGPFENKAKSLSSKGRFPLPSGHTKDCLSSRFSQETLKLVKESTVISTMIKYAVPGSKQELMNEAMLLDRYEASDIMATPDGSSYLIVFDNTVSIGHLQRGVLTSSRGKNGLITWNPDKDTDEDNGNGFEAMTFNKTSQTFLFMKETHVEKNGDIRSFIYEVKLNPKDPFPSIDVVARCHFEKQFSSENKGIEGAAFFTIDSRSYLLALCEGNFCESGKRGRIPGNGRILMMERHENLQGNCSYKVNRVINIPAHVDFEDYSSISLHNNNKIAIVSQENSAVWIADILLNELGDISFSKGRILDFPRNDNCEIVYCNVEGVYFEGDDMIVTVSDKMKGKGKQPFICQQKGQMMHAFVIPP